MEELFVQLAFVMGLAVIISIIMKVLRQPLIIGYIFTGIIAGPYILGLIQHGESIEIFASLGVALLLFIVGLGLNPEMIKDVGSVSIITGLAQILFTSILGLGLAMLLGFSFVSALYLAIGFTFSSTIIILRLLYEKEEQETLYGKISIGFLLVQDLVAMIVFVFLSSSSAVVGGHIFITLAWVLIKLAIVGCLLYFVWKYLIPQVDKILLGNKQILFIFGIGMCFIMASIFFKLGFSLELGALVAGVLLSTSPYHREIATRIQPLRDFFLVIFFIFLGTNIVISSIMGNIGSILIFSAFILVGNPFIVLIIMTLLGHTRKTAFFAGLTVAQISEFSLILIGIGISVGHIPEELLSITTIIGLITIAVSTYYIKYNNELYTILKPVIKVLTYYAQEDKEHEKVKKSSFKILLFGSHRGGGGIIKSLKEQRSSYLVIDYDPNMVEILKKKKVPIIFGSADDIVLLDELDFSKTKIVICTIPSVEINSFIIDYMKKRKPDAIVICLANHNSHAQRLYQEGADYVVLPPYISREFLINFFKKNQFETKKYTRAREKHLIQLKHLMHPH